MGEALQRSVERLLRLRETPAEALTPGAGGQPWCTPRLFGGVVLGASPGPSAPVRAFLRDGFRYTPFRHRRLPQWALGTLVAATPFWREPFALPVFSLRPGVQEAEHLLWLPLRRKVRLLDFASGRSLVALRPDAEAEGFVREVALRASGDGPWPPLWEHDARAGYYVEPLLDGFALSRAPASVDVRSLLRRAMEALRRWSESSTRPAEAADYTERLARHIESLSGRVAPSMSAEAVARFRTIVERLLPAAAKGPLRLAPAHGDLQLGNMLWDRVRRRIWILDWEHHGERQAGHDRLVLGLASRSGGGFTPRLLLFLSGSRRFPFEPFERAPSARRAIAARFLLEELHFHLRESLVGDRPLPSAGLLRYLAWAPRWAARLGRAR